MRRLTLHIRRAVIDGVRTYREAPRLTQVFRHGKHRVYAQKHPVPSVDFAFDDFRSISSECIGPDENFLLACRHAKPLGLAAESAAWNREPRRTGRWIFRRRLDMFARKVKCSMDLNARVLDVGFWERCNRIIKEVVEQVLSKPLLNVVGEVNIIRV